MKRKVNCCARKSKQSRRKGGFFIDTLKYKTELKNWLLNK
jgi:hypothetical protein